MATKRFAVVEGNTPGKPACKRTVAVHQEEVHFIRNLKKGVVKAMTGQRKKSQLWFNTFVCFGKMLTPIDGQQPKTWIFGIHVQKL